MRTQIPKAAARKKCFLTVLMILTDDFFIELADFEYFYR